MAGRRFCKYELRTTDVGAGRAFYTDLLGADLWGPEISVAPLPEAAAARGARPHWLGHLDVGDVEATLAALVARGGQPLGPLKRDPGGWTCAGLRDPFGAVLALCSGGPASRAPIAWHLLCVRDLDPAFALYAELFGWAATGAGALEGELGQHQTFAWDPGAASVGSVTNSARQPGIHTQWLYFFPVADLEAARARVTALGGLALPALRTPLGGRAAACDDPQGGAFGLYQGPA